MLSLAMMFWVGYTLSAPVWYWVCWGIVTLCQIITFGIKCYKKGREM